MSGGVVNLSIDECREAFDLATHGDWRSWPDYIDAILDAALEVQA